MAAVADAVRRAGGRIVVNSVRGAGTTIVMEIPKGNTRLMRLSQPAAAA